MTRRRPVPRPYDGSGDRPPRGAALSRSGSGVRTREPTPASARSAASLEDRSSRPWASTSTWSAICSTSLSAWLETSTVRPSSASSPHVPAQPPHARRVEAVRRLVQDEDVRVAEHRRGQPQSLPHAEGELPDPPPCVRGEPGLGQDPHRRVPGQPRRRRQDAQVVERGAPGVVAGRLEDRADLTHRVRQLVVPPAAERRGPAARCDETQQHPQGGGLAGAVGSEQGRDLARPRDGADLVDRANVPERLGEAAELDGQCHGRPPAPASARDRSRSGGGEADLSTPMTAPTSHSAKTTDAMPPLQNPVRHSAATT